jgi:hypothetical protein
MTVYFDRAMTRVVVAPLVADITAPTESEIDAGAEITSTLTSDGLDIGHTETTVSRTKWRGTSDIEVPSRYKTNIILRGYRHTAAAADLLWNLAATFRGRSFLIIRRGIPYTTDWATGQRVEVYHFQWGKRSGGPSGGARVMEVRCYVTAEDDGAEVT